LGYLDLIYCIIKGPGLDILERIVNKILRKKSDFQKFHDISTIGVAQEILFNNLPERKFKDVLNNLKNLQ
jgi:hypothetical protein